MFHPSQLRTTKCYVQHLLNSVQIQHVVPCSPAMLVLPWAVRPLLGAVGDDPVVVAFMRDELALPGGDIDALPAFNENDKVWARSSSWANDKTKVRQYWLSATVVKCAVDGTVTVKVGNKTNRLLSSAVRVRIDPPAPALCPVLASHW